MMPHDPWHSLIPPADPTLITARRVDPTTKWNFFWGCDSDARCLLVLRHRVPSVSTSRLPRLKGVEVFLRPAAPDGEPSLVVRLLDSRLRDIFYELCIDIIGSTRRASSEVEAVAIAISRTWRWHHLLRGGGSGLLSQQEQMGLLGELFVLERYLLSSLAPSAAIAAWRGPVGGAKDFVAGRTGIESKARGPSSCADVLINSEYQLDESGLDNLFLHLCVFETVRPEDEGFTLTDVTRRIRDHLIRHDETVTDRYDALLTAAGFFYDDDYTQERWAGGERSIFRIQDGFPRLQPAVLPLGIGEVRYVLSLRDCGQFLIAAEVLHDAVAGIRYER